MGTERIELGELVVLGAEDISRSIEHGQIAVCLPFLLEAGSSARDGTDRAERLDELQSLPHVVINADVERRALDEPVRPPPPYAVVST